MRILVVDDDAAVQDLIVLALADQPHEVVTADHGVAALEVLGEWLPDVILLDLRMPIMDGRAFARAARERAGLAAPIIVMSSEPNAEAQAAEIRAAGTLSKPFDLADLARQLGRFAVPQARRAA
jgi:CheY-like chemotaxis protein